MFIDDQTGVINCYLLTVISYMLTQFNTRIQAKLWDRVIYLGISSFVQVSNLSPVQLQAIALPGDLKSNP